ncbi:MAG: LysM peptidoglycan-binding domain-containing protein [Chloroflexi bacterium]|nr:LysM peptidoglycan-binding domain-containing protein [Chloroflexota bacterium]
MTLPRVLILLIVITSVTLPAFFIPSSSRAESPAIPDFADTVYDLVNAVNALRTANGLPPYAINSILMYTAQSQADFMAATGNVTHSGPGGIGLTDRLLAAGYPLAGDLSLGGFRAENITSGSETMTAQAAVNQWTGDAPHLNTMLSSNLTEIGAGVAVANGRVYYVVDCARPTAAGAPQVPTPAVGMGTSVPVVVEAPILPVVVSTPNADGNVVHEVQYGQTLWQIAVTYETKIDEIKRLNNLSGNDIYPGDMLLIRTGIAASAPSPTEATTSVSMAMSTVPPVLPTNTLMSQLTSTLHLASFTPISFTSPGSDTSSIAGVVIGIIVIALLGGGIITWLGSSKKEPA